MIECGRQFVLVLCNLNLLKGPHNISTSHSFDQGLLKRLKNRKNNLNSFYLEYELTLKQVLMNDLPEPFFNGHQLG